MASADQASLGKVPKGSDIKVPFRYEGSNGPVDLNDLSGMIVKIYLESEPNTVIASFDTGQQYGDIIFDNAGDGEFHVKVQSDKTGSADEGWYVGEVKIAETDQAWNDGKFHDIMKTGRLFNIVSSQLTSELP